ncbi:kinesin-like protein KIF27 [Xyrichtys novacula]|uniref:Kinesin-like protein KIF27 n=1 Tax=Xyrichtys novacula TaxID=13765 RepID=A0AAV1G7W8_XYRNO|nr:kinesin-like protein KIF27 [Xyrichtys novacula]
MGEVCVRVAVRIRPLLRKEVLHNRKVCVRTVPGSTQVMVDADRVFSFDQAFGPTASQDQVYESCVQPLLESLMDGYNATVFCYGQTGSGKTYTLGGGNLDDEGGIIDHVAQDVFLLLEEKRRSSDGFQAAVRVTYIELHKEELLDLLEPPTIRKGLHIREDEKGNTVVVGVKEIEIKSAEELLSFVEMGNAVRHTATTRMNEHSSRSHTILTLQLTQHCSNMKSVRYSKLCLVDLAGSERACKTDNSGLRLKESAYINTGLLALGNVIRALSDPGRNRHGGCNAYIPYRDAKITRLLRDSLGGTAHTLMMACVSPSHDNVAETLSVLHFASKARHICNSPRATSTYTEVKSFPATWDPGEARLNELENEVQALRELLKEKEREMETKKTNGRDVEGDGSSQSSYVRISDPDKEINQVELSQYRLLAQEAAALLADISGNNSSSFFSQRVQEWQDRLTAVNKSHQAIGEEWSERDDGRSEHDKLGEELSKCKEGLITQEQLLQQRDDELIQVKKEVERLLQENKSHVQALEKEKKNTRIQTEKLVDQQILIDRLRSDLMTLKDAASGAKVDAGASENLGWRSHSVPLIRHSCGNSNARRIHSSPPAYSLERVMAAFKMRGHLLLAEIEEKEEVYRPFIKPQIERKDGDEEQEEEEDILMENDSFRRSLNLTWTSRQKKSALKENLQQPLPTTGAEENQSRQNQMKKARLRARVTQRRIKDLTVNMQMKGELIKELNKSEKETRAVDHNGKEADVLTRLLTQRQRVQSEVYHSLQHLRLQRAQLQSSLSQPDQNWEQRAGYVTEFKSTCQKEGKKDRNWLEEEEERIIQKRAELQEMEEELRGREEVLQRREACLQQKNKLEIKKLHSSQAVSQDLLHVSMQLESLEEQIKSRSSLENGRGRQTGGVTREKLEKERDILRKRRDALDAQLKEFRVLTVEEEHSLLELEEAIEALDAALEFKNRSIQDKQRKLLITDSDTQQSKNTEPAQLCDVFRKLKQLSLHEVSELLVKYFNKVVCLREAERRLHLHCEELQIQADEQEAMVGEMEAAMQRLALDADRRFTQQNRDHQSNIQLLLQKLKEHGSREPQQAIQARLQHAEKELFFYKSSSRQLKKKLRELRGGAQSSVDQPTHSHVYKQTNTGANQLQMQSEESQARSRILTSYTKIQAEQKGQQTQNDSHLKQSSCQTPCSDRHAYKTTNMPDYHRIQTESQGQRDRGTGHSREQSVTEPVRLCRRELREVSPATLQDTGRRQCALDASSESILEDSIEMPKNSD